MDKSTQFHSVDDNMYALSRIKRKNCGGRVENFLTCVLIPTSIHYTCNISEVSLVDFGGSGAKSSDTRKMSKQNTVRVTARSSAVWYNHVVFIVRAFVIK